MLGDALGNNDGCIEGSKDGLAECLKVGRLEGKAVREGNVECNELGDKEDWIVGVWNDHRLLRLFAGYELRYELYRSRASDYIRGGDLPAPHHCLQLHLRCDLQHL